MKLLARERCPVCETAKREFVLSSDNRDLYKCANCGLFYLSPVRCDPDCVYDSQYYDKPKESDDLQGYFDYNRDGDRRRATFRAYLKKIKKFKNAGNILDVGCAFGDFLSVCEEDGHFDTFGVEISRYAGQKAYKRLKGDIFVGDIQDFMTTKKMDIITLWDVLEHLNEPKKALNKCNQFIDPNGIMLICTPNIKSFMFRVFRSKWIHFKPDEHINFFSEECICRLMSDLGFRLISKENHWKHISLCHLRKRISQYLPIMKYLIPMQSRLSLRFSSFDEKVYFFKKEVDRKA